MTTDFLDQRGAYPSFEEGEYYLMVTCVAP